MKTLAVISHTPAEIRDTTDEVLCGAAYDTGVQERFLPAWLSELLTSVMQTAIAWLQSAASYLDNLQTVSPVLFWLIMAALVGVLALLIWHIVYTLQRILRPSPRDALPQATKARVVRFDNLWSQAEWLSDEGKHTEAIRHLLLALLARVQDEKLVVPIGWTNREVARHLSRHGAANDAIQMFVRTVDHLWYGRQSAARDDFERCRRLVRSCVDSLHRGSPDGS